MLARPRQHAAQHLELADHGDKRAAFIQHSHITNSEEKRAKRNWLKTIKGLMPAIAEGTADNPASGELQEPRRAWGT